VNFAHALDLGDFVRGEFQLGQRRQRVLTHGLKNQCPSTFAL
jgi:hypothetical protein